MQPFQSPRSLFLATKNKQQQQQQQQQRGGDDHRRLLPPSTRLRIGSETSSRSSSTTASPFPGDSGNDSDSVSTRSTSPCSFSLLAPTTRATLSPPPPATTDAHSHSSSSPPSPMLGALRSKKRFIKDVRAMKALVWEVVSGSKAARDADVLLWKQCVEAARSLQAPTLSALQRSLEHPLHSADLEQEEYARSSTLMGDRGTQESAAPSSVPRAETPMTPMTPMTPLTPRTPAVLCTEWLCALCTCSNEPKRKRSSGSRDVFSFECVQSTEDAMASRDEPSESPPGNDGANLFPCRDCCMACLCDGDSGMLRLLSALDAAIFEEYDDDDDELDELNMELLLAESLLSTSSLPLYNAIFKALCAQSGLKLCVKTRYVAVKSLVNQTWLFDGGAQTKMISTLIANLPELLDHDTIAMSLIMREVIDLCNRDVLDVLEGAFAAYELEEDICGTFADLPGHSMQ